MLALLCVVSVSGVLLQQQVQPLKDYRAKGIGIVSCDLAVQSRSHEKTRSYGVWSGGGFIGARIGVAEKSPVWIAGLNSGDVVVRIGSIFLGGNNPSADDTFKDEVKKLSGAGQTISLFVIRNSVKVTDMLLIVKISSKEGIEDFTGIGTLAKTPNPLASPLSNFSSGGIGLAEMKPSYEKGSGRYAGRIVVDVLKESPAWAEGLRDGDEIKQVDDLDLSKGNDGGAALLKLREYLIEAKPDAELKLIIWRPTAPPEKLFSLSVKKRQGVIDREFPPVK